MTHEAPTKTIAVIDHQRAGAQIRDMRVRRGMSLRSMAKRIGISAPFLSDLELGRRAWSHRRFNQVVKLLKSK